MAGYDTGSVQGPLLRCRQTGLREMLHTQLDKLEMDTVTVPTEEERPQTDRAQTSLLDMYDEILVENETTEQRISTASKLICFNGNGDIRKCYLTRQIG